MLCLCTNMAVTVKVFSPTDVGFISLLRRKAITLFTTKPLQGHSSSNSQSVIILNQRGGSAEVA